jgi:purine-binding chemotaxis protein CheW
MSELFLIARIADQAIALPAVTVGSVIEMDRIVPVPRVEPHVAGLFALRSRILSVIDSRVVLGLGTVERSQRMAAVVVTVNDHGYALLVDAVEDVVGAPPPEPCRAIIEGRWRDFAAGVIHHGERAILVLDAPAMITGRALQAA